MKQVVFLLLCCLSIGTSFGQSSLYGQTIKDIDGNTINLSAYTGQKLLIAVAPVRQEDMLSISEIDSFKNVYGSKVKILAVLSKEDGYLDSNKAKIKAYYQSVLGASVILTEGVYTRKGSTSQSALFNWLTHRTANGRSDADVLSVGHKFLIGTDGKLVAVLPPSVPLFSVPVINYVNKGGTPNN
jgi:glutathione peroxidase